MKQPITLIDSHCHLDFADFDADREAVLARCQRNNIQHIIVPAVSANRWSQTIDTCNRHNNTHLALGLHPVFIEEHQPQHLSQLDQAIEFHSPIAVGEIGLDFYASDHTPELDREKQTLFFTKQLIIAKHHDLPVIIHNRKAHDECLSILADCPVKGGIIHAFNGSMQHAQKYIERGFLLGFGGMLTFAHSRKLRALVKQLPLSAIALETDAPDMTVAAHKGTRNSPEYLPYVVQAICEIKNIHPEEVAETTTRNVLKLFKLC